MELFLINQFEIHNNEASFPFIQLIVQECVENYYFKTLKYVINNLYGQPRCKVLFQIIEKGTLEFFTGLEQFLISQTHDSQSPIQILVLDSKDEWNHLHEEAFLYAIQLNNTKAFSFLLQKRKNINYDGSKVLLRMSILNSMHTTSSYKEINKVYNLACICSKTLPDLNELLYQYKRKVINAPYTYRDQNDLMNMMEFFIDKEKELKTVILCTNTNNTLIHFMSEHQCLNFFLEPYLNYWFSTN